jgi:hypothetical protein
MIRCTTSSCEYLPSRLINLIQYYDSTVFFSLRSSCSCSARVHVWANPDIAFFNEQVNMTANELEKWLEDPQSRDAGTDVWIESGWRIVGILGQNPAKNPDAYGEVHPPANNNNACLFVVVLFLFFSSPRDDYTASKALCFFGQEDFAHIREVVRCKFRMWCVSQ